MPLLHYDKLLTSQNVVLDMPFYKNGLCDGGKAIDKSKYHNNATVTGAIWTPPYGYTSDGIDDFLQVPNSISTPLSNADFTILAIIKRVSATAYIISRNMIFDVFYYGIEFRLLSNSLVLARRVGDANNYAVSAALTDSGVYTQVAVSYTYSTGLVELYRQGTYLGNGTVGVGAVAVDAPYDAGYCLCAERRNLADVYSNMVMSELQVLNKVITANEHKNYYLAAKQRLPWANLP